MANHVHILAVPKYEESLSRSVGRTNLLYTQYVNRKYKRSGRLWQNRFFSTIVETESYLWAVVRYIEKNPMKSKLVKKPEDYKWSSCKSNISGEGNGQLSKQGWLDLMKTYRRFLIQQGPETEQKIRHATSTGRPLGSEGFMKKLELKLSRRILPGKAGRPKKEKVE